MKTLVTLALTGTAAMFSLSAMAAPVCTKAPQSQWMPQQALKDRLAKQGYTIDRFLVSGTCYEIYGKDKAGKLVEIYFDPTDGHIVKQRSK
ncbi:MAG TPA: PepSY domain-containing protein [Rhodanobacteraceae bacterium]|nr:PepSY domain-containing protein [Rhodanobacteraceae bacterium]